MPSAISDPWYKKFLSWSWSQILFVAVNVVIVLANLLLPRFLDTPKIEVISTAGLADENELQVSNTTAYVAGEVIEIHLSGDKFFADKRCFEAMSLALQVPARCRDLLEETLNAIIESSEDEKKRKLNAIAKIDSFSKGELIEALTGDSVTAYRSQVYNDIFFSFLAVESYARDDMVEGIRDSLISSAIGLINREFAYIEYLTSLRNQLRAASGSTERSGEFAIRAILTNNGHAGGVVYPGAKIQIAGESVNLVLDEKSLLADSLSNASAKYELLNQGQVVELYYIVDPINSTEKAKQLMDKLILQDTPQLFSMTLNSSEGTIEHSGTLSFETVSFDLDFAEPRLRYRF